MSPALSRHAVTRVSHPMRTRTVRVVGNTLLTPNMRRVVVSSPDLHDFAAPGPDDHCKLVFPDPAAPGGDHRRVYTPRYFDNQAGTLTLDFAMHDAGPAMAWAKAARVGDALTVLGPKKSMVVADDFDWYLLIGDETALPAIGRRLETLRAGVPVTTLVALRDDADRQEIRTDAAWTAHWPLYRDVDGLHAGLTRALAAHALPPGDGYVWIATEGRVATRLRDTLLDERRHPAAWLKASAYWHRPEAERPSALDGLARRVRRLFRAG